MGIVYCKAGGKTVIGGVPGGISGGGFDFSLNAPLIRDRSSD